MDANAIARSVSGLILLFGLVTILGPGAVSDFLLDMENSGPTALGEFAAVYGGGFATIGGLAFWGTIRRDETGAGWVWVCGAILLGVAVGRLLAIFTAGDPGWWGYLSLIVEIAGGGFLVFASADVKSQPVSFSAPPSKPSGME